MAHLQALGREHVDWGGEKATSADIVFAGDPWYPHYTDLARPYCERPSRFVVLKNTRHDNAIGCFCRVKEATDTFFLLFHRDRIPLRLLLCLCSLIKRQDSRTELDDTESNTVGLSVKTLPRRARLWNSLALVPRFVSTILDLIQEVLQPICYHIPH